MVREGKCERLFFISAIHHSLCSSQNNHYMTPAVVLLNFLILAPLPNQSQIYKYTSFLTLTPMRNFIPPLLELLGDYYIGTLTRTLKEFTI